MIDSFEYVEDVKGNRYRLTYPLGKAGGQGRVYATQDGKYAIKLLHASQARVGREQLRHKLEEVRRLSLDELPFARPIEMLRSHLVG